MCGIHLIVDKKCQLQDSSAIESMLQSSRHRGPDQEAFKKVHLNDKQLFFGVNRLSITNLSDHSSQPLSTENHILCFNGELYNAEQIRKSIAGKSDFRSDSDTEVVFGSLIKNGMESILAFNGMFGLIFFDNQSGKLFLARDSSGMKPLFYTETENYLIASSELNSIFASGLVSKELNASVIPHYLAFRYVPTPETFYKGVFQIVPGTIREIDLGSSFNGQTESLKKTAELKSSGSGNLSSVLQNAVERHLSGLFQPILFLSGGIDSSLLLGTLNGLGYEKFPAVSVGFDDASRAYATSDSEYALMAASKFNAELNTIQLDINALDTVPEFFSRMNQPVADNAAFLTHIISKKASELNYKIALTGAGADELFGGYNRHWAYYKYLQNPFLFKTATSAVSLLQSLSQSGKSQTIEKIRQFKKIRSALSAYESAPFAGFCMLTEFMENFKSSEHELVKIDSLNEALYFDEQNYLVNDVLALTDEQSMFNSLEVRMPFLDREVVDFAHAIPESRKLAKGKKWMLKDLLIEMGLAQIAERKKEGFGMPLNYWFTQKRGVDLLKVLEDEKNSLNEFVSNSYIRTLVKNQIEGRHDHSAALWSLLTLHFWLEENL